MVKNHAEARGCGLSVPVAGSSLFTESVSRGCGLRVPAPLRIPDESAIRLLTRPVRGVGES